MREAQVEAALVRGAKAKGCEVRKIIWVGRRHAPDRILMWPPTGQRKTGWADFVELKAPGKTARPGQRREHERLRALGFDVYVLDTIEKVEAYLEGLLG